MEFRLIEQSRPEPSGLRGYDPEYDYVLAILSDICDRLAPCARFEFSGFGRETWQVDVRVDLCVFIEDVPTALARLDRGQDFELSLCEQGIQCQFDVAVREEVCDITCRCWSEWQPQPAVVSLPSAYLRKALETLLTRFCDLSEKVFPGVGKHPWFANWLATRPS